MGSRSKRTAARYLVMRNSLNCAFFQMVFFSGPMETNDEINIMQMNITWLRIPTGGRQTSKLFSIVTKELISGITRATPGAGSQRDMNPRPPDFKSRAITPGHAACYRKMV